MADKIAADRKRDNLSPEIDLSSPALDDIGLEDPFGEGGVDEGGGRKPSKPTKEILTQTIKGVGQGLKGGIVHEIKKQMPNTAGLVSEISDTYTEFKDLKSEISRQLSPMLITLEDSARRVLPRAKKLLPRKLYDKVQQKLDKRAAERRASTYTPKTKEQNEQEYIGSEIAQIFAQQSEKQQAIDLEAKKNELTHMALDSTRHKQTSVLLTHVYDSLHTQEMFHRTIHAGYMRKSLELKYKHLFIARDTYNLLSRSLAAFEGYYKGLLRNTSLPDMMKVQIGDYHRKNVIESYGKTMANFKGNIRRHIIDAIKTKAKDAVQAFGFLADQIGTATEMQETMSGLPGMPQTDPRGTAANLIARGLSFLGIAPVARKYLKRIKPLTDNLEATAKNFKTNAFLNAANLRRRWGTSDNRILRFMADFLPNMQLTQKGSNELLTRATEATPFDKMTRTSIVEIIPGYLGKILHSIEKIRTGNDDVSETVYNVYSRRFTTVEELHQSASNQIYGSEASRRSGFVKAIGGLQAGLAKNRPEEDPDKYYEKYTKDINRFLVNHAVFAEFLNVDEIKAFVGSGGVSNITPYIGRITTGFEHDPVEVLKTILHGMQKSDGSIDKYVYRDIQDAINTYRNQDSYKTEMPRLFEVYGYRDKFADKISTAQKQALVKAAMDGDEAAAKILSESVGLISDENELNLAGVANVQSDIKLDEALAEAKMLRQGKLNTYKSMADADKQVADWMENSTIGKTITSVGKGAAQAARDIKSTMSEIFMSREDKIMRDLNRAAAKMGVDTSEGAEGEKKEAEPEKEKTPAEVATELFSKYGERAINGLKTAIKNPSEAYAKSSEFIRDRYNRAKDTFLNSETGKKVAKAAEDATAAAKEYAAKAKETYDEKMPEPVKEALNRASELAKQVPEVAEDLLDKIEDAYETKVPKDVRDKITEVRFQVSDEIRRRSAEASDLVKKLMTDPEFRADQSKKARARVSGILSTIPTNKEEFSETYAEVRAQMEKAIAKGKTTIGKTVASVTGGKTAGPAPAAPGVEGGSSSEQVASSMDGIKETLSDSSAKLLEAIKNLKFTGTPTGGGAEISPTPIGAPASAEIVSAIDKFRELFAQHKDELKARDEKREKQLDDLLTKMAEGHDAIFASTNWINKTLREMPPAIATGTAMPSGEGGGGSDEKLGFFGRGGAKVKGGFRWMGRQAKWAIGGIGKVYSNIYGGLLKGLGNAAGGLGEGVKGVAEFGGKLLESLKGGKLLDKIGGGLKNIGKGYVEIYKSAFNNIGKVASTVASGLFGSKAQPYVDIYRKDEIGGEYKPILTAAQQEREPGVFFKDGKRLRNSEDITEPIYDVGGKELITQNDIDHGLVGADNKPISTKKGSQGIISKVLDIGKGIAPGIGKAIHKTFGVYLDMFKGLFNLGVGGIKGVGKVAGSFINRLFGFDVGGTSKELLELIRKIQSDVDLLAKGERKGRRKGDTDDDGDIDGTYEDQMQKKRMKDALGGVAGGHGKKHRMIAPGVWVDEDGNIVEDGEGGGDGESSLLQDIITWHYGEKGLKWLGKKMGKGKGAWRWVRKGRAAKYLAKKRAGAKIAGAVAKSKWLSKIAKFGKPGKIIAGIGGATILGGSAIAGGAKAAAGAAGKAGEAIRGAAAGAKGAQAAGAAAKGASAATGAAQAVGTTGKVAGKTASALGTAGKFVGKAAVPVAIAAEGLSGGMEAYDAYKQGDVKAGNHAVASTAGSIGGGLLGAKGGAAAGAAIGAIGGPVGAAIGGAIGGIVGAIGGSWAGGKAAGAGADAIYDGLTKDKDGNPVQAEGPGRTESTIGSNFILNGMWQGIKGNDLEMTKAEIEQARAKFKRNIEKGRPGYDKVSEKFENAIAEGNWRLARQLSGKEADGFIAATWKHSIIGSGISNLGAFFLGIGKDNEAMTQAEIDKVHNKFQSIMNKGGPKARHAERLLNKFDDYVADGDWKRARAIAGEDFQKGWGVFGAIGSGIKNFFVADEGKPMTEEEVKKARERLTKLADGGNKAAQKILDQFDEAVTEMNWKKARKLVGAETISGLAATGKALGTGAKWAARILSLGLTTLEETDQNTPLTDEEIKKFTDKMNYLIDKKNDKLARKKLDKFEDAVAKQKWDKARLIAKMPHKSIGERMGKAVGAWLVGDDDKEMTEQEIQKFRDSMQRKIDMGSKTAKKKLEAFEDAIGTQRWNRARKIADMPDDGVIGSAGKAIGSGIAGMGRWLFGGDGASMSEEEIKKARIKLETAVKDGKKNAQRRLDMFEDYVADERWDKARALAKMPYENVLARTKKAVVAGLFGDDESELTPEEIEKFQNECEQRIEDGDKKAEKILEKFNEAVESENWNRARAIAGIKDWGVVGSVGKAAKGVWDFFAGNSDYDDCMKIREELEDKALDDESGVLEKGLEDFMKLVRRQKYNEAYDMAKDLLKMKPHEIADKYKLSTDKLDEYKKTADALKESLLKKADNYKGGIFDFGKVKLAALAKEVSDAGKWCDEFFEDIKDRANSITGEEEFTDIDKPDEVIMADGEQLIKDIEKAQEKFSWFTSPVKRTKLANLKSEVQGDITSWCTETLNKWKERLGEIDEEYKPPVTDDLVSPKDEDDGLGTEHVDDKSPFNAEYGENLLTEKEKAEGVTFDREKHLVEVGQQMEAGIGKPKSFAGKFAQAVQSGLGIEKDNNLPTVEDMEATHPNWMDPNKIVFEEDEASAGFDADAIAKATLEKKREQALSSLPDLPGSKWMKGVLGKTKFSEKATEQAKTEAIRKMAEYVEYARKHPERSVKIVRSLFGMTAHGMIGTKDDGWEFGTDIGEGKVLRRWINGESKDLTPEQLSAEDLAYLTMIYDENLKKKGIAGDYANEPSYMAQNELNRRQMEASGNDGHGAVGKAQSEAWKRKKEEEATKAAFEQMKDVKPLTMPNIDFGGNSTANQVARVSAAVTAAKPISAPIGGSKAPALVMPAAETSPVSVATKGTTAPKAVSKVRTPASGKGEFDTDEEAFADQIVAQIKDDAKYRELCKKYNVVWDSKRINADTVARHMVEDYLTNRSFITDAVEKEEFIDTVGLYVAERLQEVEYEDKTPDTRSSIEQARATAAKVPTAQVETPKDRTEERKPEVVRTPHSSEFDAEQAEAEGTYDTVSRSGGVREDGTKWDKLNRSGIRIGGDPISKSGLTDKQMGLIGIGLAMGKTDYPDYVMEMYNKQLPDYEERTGAKPDEYGKGSSIDVDDDGFAFCKGGFTKRFAKGGIVKREPEPEPESIVDAENTLTTGKDYENFVDKMKQTYSDGSSATAIQKIMSAKMPVQGFWKNLVNEVTGKELFKPQTRTDVISAHHVTPGIAEQFAGGGFIDSIRSKIGDVTGQGERDTMQFAHTCVKHFENIGIDKIAKFLSTDDANHDPADLLQEFPLPEGTKVGPFCDPRTAAELAIQMMCQKHPEIQKAMEIRTGGLSFDPYEQMKAYLSKQGKFADGGFLEANQQISTGKGYDNFTDKVKQTNDDGSTETAIQKSLSAEMPVQGFWRNFANAVTGRQIFKPQWRTDVVSAYGTTPASGKFADGGFATETTNDVDADGNPIQYGEAGSEAILPLTRRPGNLLSRIGGKLRDALFGKDIGKTAMKSGSSASVHADDPDAEPMINHIAKQLLGFIPDAAHDLVAKLGKLQADAKDKAMQELEIQYSNGGFTTQAPGATEGVTTDRVPTSDDAAPEPTIPTITSRYKEFGEMASGESAKGAPRNAPTVHPEQLIRDAVVKADEPRVVEDGDRAEWSPSVLSAKIAAANSPIEKLLGTLAAGSKTQNAGNAEVVGYLKTLVGLLQNAIGNGTIKVEGMEELAQICASTPSVHNTYINAAAGSHGSDDFYNAQAGLDLRKRQQ